MRANMRAHAQKRRFHLARCITEMKLLPPPLNENCYKSHALLVQYLKELGKLLLKGCLRGIIKEEVRQR